MIAIISDVHGNYPALMAVLAEIDKHNCTKIISLGDVCGYYCMVNECIEELKKRNVLHILGNHDSYIINDNWCPRSNSANKCLKYQKKILTSDNLDWLKKAQPAYETDNISCVHGGWSDNLDEYLLDIPQDYFENYNKKFFFSGHTHIQLIKNIKEKTYCNPGSVGQPRDNNPKAAFALFDIENIILKRVEYDIPFIGDKMQKANFDKYFYSNLHKGIGINSKKDDGSIDGLYL